VAVARHRGIPALDELSRKALEANESLRIGRGLGTGRSRTQGVEGREGDQRATNTRQKKPSTQTVANDAAGCTPERKALELHFSPTFLEKNVGTRAIRSNAAWRPPSFFNASAKSSTMHASRDDFCEARRIAYEK